MVLPGRAAQCRARDGSGEAMAYHYRVFLRDAGWIDERQNITATGLVELAKRERVMA